MTYEVEYRTRINKTKLCWELVRWDGEDNVIFSLPYNKSFNFKEAQNLISKLLKAVQSINSEERVY